MTVNDFSEYVKAIVGDHPDFRQLIQKERVNHFVRQVLRRGRIWLVVDKSITFNVDDISITLPNYFNTLVEVGMTDASGAVIPEIKEAALIDLEAITLFSAAAPTQYAVSVNKVMKFDTKADQIYTVFLEFYRTLSADLALTDDVNDIVKPFSEDFNHYLKEYLVELENKKLKVDDANAMLNHYIDIIRTESLIDRDSENNFKPRY